MKKFKLFNFIYNLAFIVIMVYSIINYDLSYIGYLFFLYFNVYVLSLHMFKRIEFSNNNIALITIIDIILALIISQL